MGGVILLLIAVITMACSDFLDTLNTIAESRDRPLVAGLTAGGSKTFEMTVSLLGADTLITHGVGTAAVYLAVVLITTVLVTERSEAWGALHMKGK